MMWWLKRKHAEIEQLRSGGHEALEEANKLSAEAEPLLVWMEAKQSKNHIVDTVLGNIRPRTQRS